MTSSDQYLSSLNSIHDGSRYQIFSPLTEEEIEASLHDFAQTLNGHEFKYYTDRDVRYVIKSKKHKHKEHTILVPKGFLTDGCSYCIDEFNESSWLLHDWLYATHEIKSKDKADKVLDLEHRQAALEAAEELFGKGAWKDSYHRGAYIYEGTKDNGDVHYTVDNRHKGKKKLHVEKKDKSEKGSKHHCIIC